MKSMGIRSVDLWRNAVAALAMELRGSSSPLPVFAQAPKNFCVKRCFVITV